MKSLSFCEIWNNSAPPSLDPLQIRTAGHGVLWQICVQIPGHVKSKESCCQQGKGQIIT